MFSRALLCIVAHLPGLDQRPTAGVHDLLFSLPHFGVFSKWRTPSANLLKCRVCREMCVWTLSRSHRIAARLGSLAPPNLTHGVLLLTNVMCFLDSVPLSAPRISVGLVDVLRLEHQTLKRGSGGHGGSVDAQLRARTRRLDRGGGRLSSLPGVDYHLWQDSDTVGLNELK